MLADFVQETASSPGNATTINLAGAVTGRRSFIATFGTGATLHYFMDDGTQAEWGTCTITAGSPNTLSRTTVIGNTAGNTNRLNFTGVVRVYCGLPSSRALWADGSAIYRAQSRRIADLGAATVDTDAAQLGQVAWRLLSATSWTSAQTTVAFALPSGFSKYRLELNDVAPSAAALIYLRFSFDNLATVLSGSTDYLNAQNEVRGGSNSPSSVTSNAMALTGTVASGASGNAEISPGSRYVLQDFVYMGNSGLMARAMGGGQCVGGSGAPTHVVIGAVSANLNSGRGRLLGAV